MLLTVVMLIVEAGLLAGALMFTYESLREQEPRAPKWGFALTALVAVLILLTLFSPPARPWIGVFLALGGLFTLLLFIPPKKTAASLQGAAGYVKGPVERVDERTIVFARNRSLPPEPERVEAFYAEHPEFREYDEARRKRGGPLGRPGSIDGGYRPNVAMLASTFGLPHMLGPGARVGPAGSDKSGYAKGETPREEIDPARASEIVRGWARHLGADLVGICKTDSRWTYSHRGECMYDNFEEWGQELPEPLPYAVVVATRMDPANTAAAPHTPTVVESGLGYAKGAFITTILAHWFGGLGYSAVAQHNRNYDLLMVPLAVEAGLGELGRQGYLVADKYGAGVRVFAVTTDMPLEVDSPLDIGAEEFCRRCLKCAESCPSKSIPTGEPEVVNGIRRWKLNEQTCFDYWGKVGTDCCVCMAICPFTRPDRPIHRLVRFFLKSSALARVVFPHVDNVLYGRRWRPRNPPDWIAYPKSGSGQAAKADPEEM